MAHGKFLLTSAGITNDRIREALVELLGKPISEASALYVPTAIYAYPFGALGAWQGVKSMGDLGWKEFGILELTALPDLPIETWQPRLEAADALIIGGGNKFYLSHWLQKSGLFDLLPSLLDQGKVYVGASAGSMMLTAGLNYDRERFSETGEYYDDEFNERIPSKTGSAKTLGLVDFVIRPHFQADYFPQTTPENLAKWAAKVDVPLYALDDQSAIKVVDGNVEIISEGSWKLFEQP
jgi:dipeptidase E